jgi:hypothetical protein
MGGNKAGPVSEAFIVNPRNTPSVVSILLINFRNIFCAIMDTHYQLAYERPDDFPVLQEQFSLAVLSDGGRQKFVPITRELVRPSFFRGDYDGGSNYTYEYKKWERKLKLLVRNLRKSYAGYYDEETRIRITSDEAIMVAAFALSLIGMSDVKDGYLRALLRQCGQTEPGRAPPIRNSDFLSGVAAVLQKNPALTADETGATAAGQFLNEDGEPIPGIMEQSRVIINEQSDSVYIYLKGQFSYFIDKVPFGSWDKDQWETHPLVPALLAYLSGEEFYLSETDIKGMISLTIDLEDKLRDYIASKHTGDSLWVASFRELVRLHYVFIKLYLSNVFISREKLEIKNTIEYKS